MDKNKLAVDLFNRLAQQYQDKYMSVELYSESLDVFCESIGVKNAQVLELACGPGNVTRYLLDKRPDLNILATDMAPNMIELATVNNPEVAVQLMDCREIRNIGKSFDAVMCGFALPYLSKEEAIQLIQDASVVIKDNGVFYLSTMEDDYSKSGLETSPSGNQLYMHYHEAGYLTEALKQAGFSILLTKQQNFPDPTGKKVIDLILIAKKIPLN